MPSDRTPPKDFLREKNAMLKAVQDALASQDFQSTEEANAFLNKNFTGRPMDEIIGQLSDSEHADTSRGRAEAKLNLIDPYNNTAAVNRRHALAATKIDPSFIDAWFTLAETYDSPAKAKAAYQKAIRLGKKEFAGLIEDCLEAAAKNDPEEKSWLWGHIEARPFLMACEGLAELYITQDKVAPAIALYEEILQLNGNDNQGIRYKLLPMLMLGAPAEHIDSLFASYPNDCAPEWLFTRALYEFQDVIVHKAEDGSWEPKFSDNPENIKSTTLLHQLPPECAEANSLLDQAMKSNPLVPLFLCDYRTGRFSTPDSHVLGSADEAFTIAQNFGILWLLDPIAQMWLTESCVVHHGNLLLDAVTKHHAHLLELHQMLDQVPISSIEDPEFIQPTEGTCMMRETLLNMAGSKDNKIVSFDA